MRIVCPACNVAYQIPDDRLSAGRVVRCARCGTDWAPIEAVPDADPAAERAEARPEPESVAGPEPALELGSVIEPPRVMIGENIPRPRPPLLANLASVSRESMLLMVAWVVSLAMVGTALAGLYVGRERVMTAWPPSIRAYAALGMGGLVGAAARPVVSERRQ